MSRNRGLWCAPVLLALAPVATALQVFAAGDIADCRDQQAPASAAAATARLLADGAPVIILGDIAYPRADRATLETCFGPTWGEHRGPAYVVLGNHDVIHGSSEEPAAYFAGRSGPRDGDVHRYRAQLGDWWLIGLDSNLDRAALDEQLAWLRATLAAVAGDGRCLIAAWHHPLLSTGLHSGDGDRMRPFWAALDAAGADLVLNGHEHYYEAYGPRDGRGRPAAEGIREFIVGTGGGRLGDVSFAPWQHRAFSPRHGVLALELGPGSYSWRFLATDGTTRDSGSGSCRRALSRGSESGTPPAR